MDTIKNASRRLALIGRKAVIRVGVNVGAQLMRRNLPTSGKGNGDHMLRRRRIAHQTIKPFRHVRLTHLAGRLEFTNAPRQLALASD